MFGDGSLTFREFAMRERVPLATIHEAVLEFLRGRGNAAVFGAQAVNAYVDEPRMTQLLAFPELQAVEGPVAEVLRGMDAPSEAFHAWRKLAAEEILPEDEDAGF